MDLLPPASRHTMDAKDMKLELVAVPATDVDRAKAFYVDQVGRNADHDHVVTDALRFVQPPPRIRLLDHHRARRDRDVRSQQGLQLVVDDIEAACDELRGCGVQTSDADDQPWGRFIFSDPDSNTWAVQQIPPQP